MPLDRVLSSKKIVASQSICSGLRQRVSVPSANLFHGVSSSLAPILEGLTPSRLGVARVSVESPWPFQINQSQMINRDARWHEGRFHRHEDVAASSTVVPGAQEKVTIEVFLLPSAKCTPRRAR